MTEETKKPLSILIELSDNQNGYEEVGKYISRYWEHNITTTVIVSLAKSYDGRKYEILNEVANPYGYKDIEFDYDWWEGEKYILLLGIKNINELKITGGLYN